MITASYLFASSKHNPGNQNCFYCGIDCDESYTTKEYVKKTFTNRDIVKFPQSDYICGCCLETLSGHYDVTQIDGTLKTGRAGQPRNYSWVLTRSQKSAFTKRHLDFARKTIFNPPEPPFAIILADSSQKQLIFKSPVNFDRKYFSVMLEEKPIEVCPEALQICLDRAILCCAAIGKIALKSPEEFINYQKVIELYGDEKPLVEWINIYNTPMGQLAAWLCPGKKEVMDYANVISRRI